MKNVIITGSANGVGKSVAKILKDNNLILIDNDEENLIKIANDLECDYYVCDVSSEKDVAILFEKIKEKYNNIDCLINCAGMWISGDMSKLTQPIYKEMNEIERLKKVIDTNIFGTIAMIENTFPI